jgi:tetratricopeptide (TPR) repeat protein
MATKLTYQSSFEEIGWSLRQTLDEINLQGETPVLKYDMLLKYGRISLMEGQLDKAYKVFQQCSIHAIDNDIPDVKELYYWSCRCLEEKGEADRAVNGYLRLLENKTSIESEEFVNAVLDRLNLHRDINALVNDFKKIRYEELNNPKDMLDKVIKFFREKN